ncbi:Dyp-type peroxidase [Pedobacter psychrodurus]|uniref:Dyp-type peroxidase n=1 Tax=Pedobacter psychrodurus TaxID=2530456 RepID=UPI00292EE500|nr:Dyp-type peroxidase [Pedobacter psychrodurus]
MQAEFKLTPPQPILEPPYQSGISDPKYSLLPPQELEDEPSYDLYKGLVDKQNYLTVIKADVFVKEKQALKTLLKVISDMSREEMLKKPSVNNMLALDIAKIPVSWRLTITIALGYSLFIDAQGNDRFGLSYKKPKNLKLIPRFHGDEFNASETISDLLIVVASDHPYINIATTRFFAEYTDKKHAEKTGSPSIKSVFKVRSAEQGFGRPDLREFLKFNDGIDNLRSGTDLEPLVYVDSFSNEPEWCLNGSYLVYKKIREMMPIWEAFSNKQQEHIIGREKDSGQPLSRQKEGTNNLTPVYPAPKDARDGPLNAHIRKVQPRRQTPDMFGKNDLDRRFLRRPYPFFDGVDENGKSINGLHFLAFMKSIQDQFEHVTNMWQMNPNFPVEGTGVDALYAKGVLKSIDGGYYFCPPGVRDENDFIGSGLFEKEVDLTYKVPTSIYGYGITFVDIDETIFNTFATIKVIKNNVLVRTLDNQQFNTDTLSAGETYDFGSFKDAKAFLATSKPIVAVIRELKRILNIITSRSEGSKIIFLTARSDFDNKDRFLNTFRKYGIDINSSRMYVERTGNIQEGTVAEKKKKIVTRYLSEGSFRRVRLLDDNLENLNAFLSIKESLSIELLELIRKKHGLDPDIDPIEFNAYLVNPAGEMNLYGTK